MKRAKRLLPAIEDIDNLHLAFWKASKGKRYARSVLAYQAELTDNLLRLQQEIRSGKVIVGDYRYFLVFEPKRREICASAFREQVLHHALMNVCHPYFDQFQIYDSYASRKGKGTYTCLDRARKFTFQNEWYLKLDVRQFFASVHHAVLKQQLYQRFKEERLNSILYQIIDSFEASPGRGLPIGNLTSQYFANHYLAKLDHYIKEELDCKTYVRYMDDMICWSNNKAALKEYKTAIVSYIREELQMELKPAQLNRTKNGLPFLGYRLFPYQVRLLQKSKQRFIQKNSMIYENWQRGNWTDEQCQAKLLPLVAFVDYADTKRFKQKVFEKQTEKGQSS
ncbi:MAG: RNA-directed DNA polymerase [Bacteroidota bacterium]